MTHSDSNFKPEYAIAKLIKDEWLTDWVKKENGKEYIASFWYNENDKIYMYNHTVDGKLVLVNYPLNAREALDSIKQCSDGGYVRREFIESDFIGLLEDL